MKKPFYSIVTNKAEQTAEIMIYGPIGDYYYEGVGAKQFVKDFQRLEQSVDRINVRINSPGGSVHDGLPIFNVIKASKKEVHTYVDGMAASMGAMIALAGDEVHMAKGSLLMLHNVSGAAWGNSKVLRAQAEMIDKHDVVLCSLIADRSGKTESEVMELWMNFEDHWFTPAEALEAKLINSVESYEAKDIPADVKNMSPMQVAAFYTEEMEEPSQSLLDKVVASVKNTLNIKPQNQDMNKFPKLAALAGVQASELKAEALEAVKTEIAEAEIEGVSIVLDSELEANAEKIVSLEASVTEKQTALEAAQAENVALQNRLDAAAVPATAPVAGADKIEGSADEAPAFEKTSIDLEKERIAAQWS